MMKYDARINPYTRFPFDSQAKMNWLLIKPSILLVFFVGGTTEICCACFTMSEKSNYFLVMNEKPSHHDSLWFLSRLILSDSFRTIPIHTFLCTKQEINQTFLNQTFNTFIYHVCRPFSIYPYQVTGLSTTEWVKNQKVAETDAISVVSHVTFNQINWMQRQQDHFFCLGIGKTMLWLVSFRHFYLSCGGLSISFLSHSFMLSTTNKQQRKHCGFKWLLHENDN